MLVRITAVALLAATLTTAAAYADNDGVAQQDQAVDRQANAQASDSALSADAPMSPASQPIAVKEPPSIAPDVAELADLVGIEPVKLQGAVNSTRTPPRTYLMHEGLLQPPAPPAPPPLAVSGTWAALAQCESGGNPRTNTGNGYYGMFQEDRAFWANYGNHAYARPDLAPPSEQLAAAQRGLAAQGPGAWPVCSRRIGMRR